MQGRKVLGMVALLVCTAVFAGARAAQSKAPEAKADVRQAQQQRMKDCNAEAGSKNLKGDGRKAFMSACLKGANGKSASAEPLKPQQQQKMKECNQQAGSKALNGDTCKSFMSQCLKG